MAFRFYFNFFTNYISRLASTAPSPSVPEFKGQSIGIGWRPSEVIRSFDTSFTMWERPGLLPHHLRLLGALAVHLDHRSFKCHGSCVDKTSHLVFSWTISSRCYGIGSAGYSVHLTSSAFINANSLFETLTCYWLHSCCFEPSTQHLAFW